MDEGPLSHMVLDDWVRLARIDKIQESTRRVRLAPSDPMQYAQDDPTGEEVIEE